MSHQTTDFNVDDGLDDNATEVEAPDAEIDDGNIANEGVDGNIADGGDDVLEKIKYKDMIEDFISKNTRRMLLFW